MSKSCVFKDYLGTCKGTSDLNVIQLSKQRLSSVKEASKSRGDDLKRELLESDVRFAHKNCLSTYTSSSHIARHLKRTQKTNLDAQAKRAKVPRQPFNWKTQCFFCGDECSTEVDKKNPNRWRESYECRTSDRGKGKLSFKEVILNVCDTREDDWSEQVRLRLSDPRASSDLHAADARYHNDCRLKFMADRNVAFARGRASDQGECCDDEPYNRVKDMMNGDRTNMWTSVEVVKIYESYGGSQLSRQSLVDRLTKEFSNELLTLSSPGLASVLVFRKHASSIMKITETDDQPVDIIKTAKRIKKEIVEIDIDTSEYKQRINKLTAKESVSETLKMLLSKISDDLSENELPAILIGNIITSVVRKKPTSLLIDLALLIREKKLIEHLYDYKVVCSYDEVKRFKASAAIENSKQLTLNLRSHSEGLVQAVADNFDTTISSQNGKKQTHSLALLLTQQCNADGEVKDEDAPKFPKIKKADIKNSDLPDVTTQNYYGPKKPNMPIFATQNHAPLSLKHLAHQVIIKSRGKQEDFNFFHAIATESKTPEYSGFNTRNARELGILKSKKTMAVYTPLIDLVPADHTTIYTAMVEAKRLTNATGQEHTIMTCDQQLYKVMVDITWVYPDVFSNFIPRLGGMHLLMSFIGCIGTLMANSGLEEILEKTFSGVKKMLSGKKFPMNLRSLRMVVEELLRNVIQEMVDSHDLSTFLDDASKRSLTARHWVDNLINPIFICLLFVRAEREGEWLLHLSAVKDMLPYFFAAGHQNYARYASYYLKNMESLPSEVLERFMKGEHVTRHQDGFWNGIWSDMFIETTFMRYGKGPGGIVGVTLKPTVVKKWANSLHITTQILKDLDDMRETSKPKSQDFHKEESKGRIKSDESDRAGIRKTLEKCIDPFKKDLQGLVNIFTGYIAKDEVNVHNSVKIGKDQQNKFKASWPEGFHSKISNQVISMKSSKKSVKSGEAEIFNTEVIYSRVMCLLSIGRIELEEVLRYELSPIPLSIFEKNGEMRPAKAKSDFKKALQVLTSQRNHSKPDVVIIDGCAKFWAITWPKDGTVRDLAYQLYQDVTYLLCKEQVDVYLVFDRYFEYSIKGATREQRTGNISNNHILTIDAPLPSKEIVMTSSQNKTQVIDIVAQYIIQMLSVNHFKRKFVVTFSEPKPVEVEEGLIMPREDLTSYHEEADVNIIRQCLHCADEGKSSIKVICDDTDVFILLTAYVSKYSIKSIVYMESFSSSRSTININETAKKHAKIASSLIAAHALSGCDSVPKLYKIGKKKILKVLEQGFSLTELGNVNSTKESFIQESTNFVTACYGIKMKQPSLSEARFSLWAKRTKKKLSASLKPPKLESLPPTTEVFNLNVMRAHFQAAIWNSCLDEKPPEMDPAEYGWNKDEINGCLLPTMFPNDVPPAPDAVLELIKCNCATESPCSRKSCTCASSKLSCSKFCNCHSSTCFNIWSVKDDSDDEEGDGEEYEEEENDDE